MERGGGGRTIPLKLLHCPAPVVCHHGELVSDGPEALEEEAGFGMVGVWNRRAFAELNVPGGGFGFPVVAAFDIGEGIAAAFHRQAGKAGNGFLWKWVVNADDLVTWQPAEGRWVHGLKSRI